MSDNSGRSTRRRLRSNNGSFDDSPSTRARTGQAEPEPAAAPEDSEEDPQDLLEQMYDAQEGADDEDTDDSDFDPATAALISDTDGESPSEWEEVEDNDDQIMMQMLGAGGGEEDNDDEEEDDDDDGDDEDEDEDDDDDDDDDDEVGPAVVRRATANSRAFMQRILHQLTGAARAGGDDSDDEETWEEQEDEHAAAAGAGVRRDARVDRRRRGPQKPLEADVAWAVSRDTSADSVRQPMEPAETAKTGTAPGGAPVRNLADLLARREAGCTNTGHFTPAQRAHVTAFRSLPMVPRQQVDSMASRVYNGRFSRSGNVYVAAFQHERKVRVYEADNNWRLRKDVHARNLRWTVTDTDISPTEQFLIYSSITPDVHLVNLAAGGGVASEANVTDIHEALHFHSTAGPDDADDPFDRQGGFGIWSVRWSADGREILAGTGEPSLYIYDVAEGKPTLRIQGHRDDVNAVAWADDSGNLLLSGSDDRLCKLWDRRTAEAARGVAAGNFVGHMEGVTSLDPKGDGRHFISNGKDQTVKLWDLRRAHSQADLARGVTSMRGLPRFQWDYRWMAYPGTRRNIVHPHDVSLMTYRGHAVLQTLIRAYFSPAATTGQRYIYSGSADGAVYIWDLVSGQQVSRLAYHQEIVRDCSWHPTQPSLVTASFDGTIVRWETKPSVDEEPGERRRRRVSIPAPRNDQLG